MDVVHIMGAIWIAGFILASISQLIGWIRRNQSRRRAPVAAHEGLRSPIETLVGRARVIDADGIRVHGFNIRMSGLDAPEWNQPAKGHDGRWFNDGKRVKGILNQAIGGKTVTVEPQRYDQYGRIIGTVYLDQIDVGAWLVSSGHAIAAYDKKYVHLERVARRERRGMWGYAVAYDPRDWRHKHKRQPRPLSVVGFK